MGRNWIYPVVLVVSLAGGCQSSSYTQRGTVFGGLGGAGIGALIGRATGHTAVGAAVGAGAGAIAGAAVGSQLDENQARRQAETAAQADTDPGGATTVEVLEMSRAGVPPQEIINYVNGAGMLEPLTTQDVIYLRDQGVNSEVVQAMIRAPLVGMPPRYVRILPPRRAILIEDDPWAHPYGYPHVGFSYGVGRGCY